MGEERSEAATLHTASRCPLTPFLGSCSGGCGDEAAQPGFTGATELPSTRLRAAGAPVAHQAHLAGAVLGELEYETPHQFRAQLETVQGGATGVCPAVFENNQPPNPTRAQTENAPKREVKLTLPAPPGPW